MQKRKDSVSNRPSGGLFGYSILVLLLGVFASAVQAVEVMTAAGDLHSLYLADDGTVWAQGYNGVGGLGDGTSTSSSAPVQVRTGPGVPLTDIVAIAAGRFHSLALASNGAVWAWGSNNHGQLGNGNTTTQLYAVRVRSAGTPISGIRSISAGSDHNLAITSTGTVLAWGRNHVGQLGNNTIVNQSQAINVISNFLFGNPFDVFNAKAVGTGANHSFVITADGSMRAWGNNTSGQLGDNTITDRWLPVAVVSSSGTGPLTNVTAASGGTAHTVAIANGNIHTWGGNAFGQLSLNTATVSRPFPFNTAIPSRQIAATKNNTYMLYQYGGSFYVVGDNTHGQLRLPTTTANSSTWTQIPVNATFIAAGSMSEHQSVILASGVVQAFGRNNFGQLGIGTTATPQTALINTLASWPVANMTEVATGEYHVAARKSDGTVWAWGSNNYGQLGDGTTSNRQLPTQVPGFFNVMKVAAAKDFAGSTYAYRQDGTVWAWGRNDFGQLGDGTTTNSSTPVQVSALSNAASSIAAGDYHGVAINVSGQAVAWGLNTSGQLGDGTFVNKTSAVIVGGGLQNVIAVAAGNGHSLALRANGTVWAWGANGSGQLGDTTTTSRNAPVQVSGLFNIIDIAAGGYHSLALRADGTVIAWGQNGNGQLGDGTTTGQNSPVQVLVAAGTALGSVKTLAGGAYASFAILTDGTMRSFGSNFSGQLGTNSTSSASYAVPVAVLGNAMRCDGGYLQTVGLTAKGQVYCWGGNGSGQIGDGTFAQALVPTLTSREWLPQVSLTILNAAAHEAGPTVGRFTLTRTGSTAGSLPVSYGVSGNAIAGVDYTGLSGLGTIPSGSSSVTVTMTPLDDFIDEVDDAETVIPNLSAQPERYRLGVPNSGVMTIGDRDVAGIQFLSLSGTTFESDALNVPQTARSFRVRLTSMPVNNVTLAFTSSNLAEGRVDANTATAGYQNQTSLLIIAANWNSYHTVHVYGQDDFFVDGKVDYTISTAVTSADGKYQGISAPVLNWENRDNDFADVLVDATFPSVTEGPGGGNAALFTIRLSSQPYSPVTLSLSSDDTSEGQLAAGEGTKILNGSNWQSGVTVTVLGVEDDIADGDVDFKIKIQRADSVDTAYNGLGGWMVAGICTDNDVKGVLVPGSVIALAEGAAPVLFPVSLTSQPIGGNVIVTFSGDAQVTIDTDPGTVGDQYSLTFTAANWNVAQYVAARAIDDALIEVGVGGTVTGGVAGGDYAAGVSVAPIAFSITDNDSPGVLISPTTTTGSRQVTTEAGGTAAFTVRLQTQPSAGNQVTVRLNSNDITEGQVNGSIPLTTVSANNSTGRFQFAGGTNLSAVVPGSRVYVAVGATANSGRFFDVITRNDGADWIAVSGMPDLGTSPSPEALTIAAPRTLTFTDVDWNVPQTVTVTGQDDGVTDGDSDYEVQFLVVAATTTETAYVGLTISDQFFTNQDDDVAGVAVQQSGGSTIVNEADLSGSGQDSFTVRLNTEPAAGTLVFVSIGTADGQTTVDKTVVVFSPTGGPQPWNSAQTVTVTAVDDAIAESSSHPAAITFSVSSGDGAYASISVSPLTAQVLDNDSAGILVSPTTGLFTTEGLQTATFTVVLTSRPTVSVTIPLSIPDSSEGSLAVSQVVFAPNVWNVPQPVVVTGVNDDQQDGDIAYTVATGVASGGDGRYEGLNPPDVLLINRDNDVAAVIITGTGGGTAVTEGGGTDTYMVRLATEPLGPVMISISGGSQVNVSPTVLTFTGGSGGTWSINQAITVTADNDAIAEGLHSATISHVASGGGYAGVTIANVTVAITDNDAAGILMTEPMGGLITNEDGTPAQFSMHLGSQPLANVTVVFTIGDGTEGSLTPPSLTFTPVSFLVDQVVTVYGLNDALADGDVNYDITVSVISADNAYNGYSVLPISVTNEDDDAADYQISAISRATNEGGGQASFTIRLRSQPTGSVTLAVSTDNATEGVANLSSITFTPSNWNDLVYVNVTGVDDFVADGTVGYQVVLSADSATADNEYRNLLASPVAVQNADDDIVGILVSTPNIAVTEGGGQVSAAIALRSEPTGDVTIALLSSDVGEATIVPSSLTFGPGDWNISQSVTVAPVDDDLVDGDQIFTITVGPATSSDPAYDGLAGPAIAGSTQDNDQAAFVLSASSGQTSEAGGTTSFDIVLTSQPTDPVVITVTGMDAGEGTVSSTSITFLPVAAPASQAWDAPQVITVSGLDDFVDDGDVAYALTFTPSGADSTYGGLTPKTFTVTNLDNDFAGVSILESSGSTQVDEAGVDDQYTIGLNSRPVGVVTITVTPDSQVRVNGIGSALVLTFDPNLTAPDPSGWNTVHDVVVSAVQDTFDESDPHLATITHAVSGYGSVTAPPITVTVIDNNPPSVIVNAGITVGRAGTEIITDAMLAYTDVETVARNLVFNVVLAPGQGDLLRSGVVLANGGSFTMGDITDGLISYRNAGTPNIADGFAFRVRDTVGNQSDLAIFNITITGFIPPIITFNTVYSPTFTEGPTPLVVDTAPDVRDDDSTYFTLLTVNVPDATVDDEVFLVTTGSITLVNSAGSGSISHSGTPIGTFVGGSGTTPLTVTFLTGTTGDAQVTDLLAAMRFRNLSEDPVSGQRTLRFVLRDETSTDSPVVEKLITVIAVNDPPFVMAATLITPKNVAVSADLVVGDVDGYPLNLTVIAPPGKGTLSGILQVGTIMSPIITTLADASADRGFTYSPLAGREGTDSFTVEVEDPYGATTQATITVIIVGGASSRPWIVSDPPLEVEAGSTLAYDIVVDFSDFISSGIVPSVGDVAYSLVGTLPSGVTLIGFALDGSDATKATMNLLINVGATGVIEAGIVVTETANNTTGYQPITIVIVPAGSLGG